MRVALYARVSTEDQTCEAQLRELRQHVQAQGWTVYREYVDAGVSGAAQVRPAHQLVLADASRKRFDLVLVWRLDRLGRDLADLLLTVDRLKDLGVGFASLREPMIDTSSPGGALIFAVMGAMAQFERALISERTRAGMKRAQAAGVRVGRPRLELDLEIAAELVRSRGWQVAAKSLKVSVATLARRLPGVRAETPEARQARRTRATVVTTSEPSKGGVS